MRLNSARSSAIWAGLLAKLLTILLGAAGAAQAAERGLASKGASAMPPGAALDLDRGRLDATAAADIAHTRDAQGRLVLAPSPKVLIGLLGDNRPGKADCFKAQYTENPIRMHRLRPTRYFCVRTNQGRFAALRVLATPGERGAALTLEHRTFAQVYLKSLR